MVKSSMFQSGYDAVEKTIDSKILADGLDATVRWSEVALKRIIQLGCDGEFSRGMMSCYSEFISRHTEGLEI